MQSLSAIVLAAVGLNRPTRNMKALSQTAQAVVLGGHGARCDWTRDSVGFVSVWPGMEARQTYGTKAIEMVEQKTNNNYPRAETINR